MYWRILFANQHPKHQKDTAIQDEIWQEYNTLSTTNNTFPDMLAPDLCIISQVFVFKKDCSIYERSIDRRHECAGKTMVFFLPLLECNKGKLKGNKQDASTRY
jgi:hypothetical protein